MNLLALEGMNDITTVLFVLLMGTVIVFVGMAVIVFILQMMGKIFDKIGSAPKKEIKTVEVIQEPQTQEVDEKIKAAIIGAIYMYYLNEGSDCEFVVRKIKRI